MTEEFDIIKLFEDTQKTVEGNIIALNAKAEFINELKQYFQANGLKVVKEVPDTAEEKVTK